MLCEDEEEKCNAFMFQNRGGSNCTLFTNVTNVIPKKTKSNFRDILASGKKCKYYDPFKKNVDTGIKTKCFILSWTLSTLPMYSVWYENQSHIPNSWEKLCGKVSFNVKWAVGSLAFWLEQSDLQGSGNYEQQKSLP